MNTSVFDAIVIEARKIIILYLSRLKTCIPSSESNSPIFDQTSWHDESGLAQVTRVISSSHILLADFSTVADTLTLNLL